MCRDKINNTIIANLSSVSELTDIGATISGYYSTNSSANATCTVNSDCLNNGTCDDRKCKCKSGFWGMNCNFSQTDSDEAKQKNSEILDKLGDKSYNSTNDTEKVALVLVQMTSVTQINNDNTVTKTMSVLEKISGNVDAKSSGLIIGAISNIFDIMSSSSGSNSSSNSSTTTSTKMDKALALVDKVIDSQLANSNITIVITTTNIEIHAAKVDRNDRDKMRTTLNSVLNSNNADPSSSKVTLNDDFLTTLKSVGGGSVALKKFTTNPYAAKDTTITISSSVVSFEVKDDSQTVLNITQLSTAIQIQIPRSSGKVEKGKKSACKYFDKKENKWKNDGLKLHSETAESITCNCSHLTDFGGTMEAISVVTPTGTINSDIWYTVINNFGIWACVIYFVSFCLIVVMLIGFTFNKYEPIPATSAGIRGHPDDTVDPHHHTDIITHTPNVMMTHDAAPESPEFKKDPNSLKHYKTLLMYRISPLYSIWRSNDQIECRRRISGFVNYIMLISMFLACLYSSADPDYDVRKIILEFIFNDFNRFQITLILFWGGLFSLCF